MHHAARNLTNPVKRHGKRIHFPRYRGSEWFDATLPGKGQPWVLGHDHPRRGKPPDPKTLAAELRQGFAPNAWKWPARTVYFLADLHADADALLSSLVASGGVRKTGPRDADFTLTKAGRRARFLIGGDCLDKGPGNLRLLRAIRRLIDRQARVSILAGNHDVRILMGMQSLDLPPDPRSDHWFVRMGPKVIPFLKEISEQYLQNTIPEGIPAADECRRRLFPPPSWFQDFPQVAGSLMPEPMLEREIKRLRGKLDHFEGHCSRAGLSLRQVYAAARKWQELFLHPQGEFYWFFEHMRLARREGSFLFIHAGLDNRIAQLISDHGIKHLNRIYRAVLEKDPFSFYYGPLGNTIRTKYRSVDLPLTSHGVERIRRCGIRAIAQGHVNQLQGQCIRYRKGLFNFICDATMDRNTRKAEGLKGHGTGVTIFHRKGHALGISNDYPYIKVFEPETFMRRYHGKSGHLHSRQSRRN